MNLKQSNYCRSDLLIDHAKKRSIERKINEDVTLFVMRHGETFEASNGRLVHWFNKKAADTCSVSWCDMRNAHNVAVVQAPDGNVITVFECPLKKNDWKSLSHKYSVC